MRRYLVLAGSLAPARPDVLSLIGADAAKSLIRGGVNCGVPMSD